MIKTENHPINPATFLANALEQTRKEKNESQKN